MHARCNHLRKLDGQDKGHGVRSGHKRQHVPHRMSVPEQRIMLRRHVVQDKTGEGGHCQRHRSAPQAGLRGKTCAGTAAVHHAAADAACKDGEMQAEVCYDRKLEQF